MKVHTKLLVVGGLASVVSLLILAKNIILPDITIFKVIMAPGSPSPVNWKDANLFHEKLPDLAYKLKDDVVLTTHEVRIQVARVFLRKAVPPDVVKQTGQTLLLLHGKAFTSETWEKLGTLHLMAALGHNVVAVDLPGFGKTTGAIHETDVFLYLLLRELSLLNSKPVIVSPSMSGRFSVPFVARHGDLLSGYVAVAPVIPDGVDVGALSKVNTPTIIIYGENDSTGLAERSVEVLGHLPHSQVVKLRNAGHAAYMNQPELFHQLMYNIMSLLHPDR